MQLNTFLVVAITGLLCSSCNSQSLAGRSPEELARLRPASGDLIKGAPYTMRGFAGDYLASHFAQSESDWDAAKHYLDGVLNKDPKNLELLKKSMILSMGSGDIDGAVKRAQALSDYGSDQGLAVLILAVDALSKNELSLASNHLINMPKGDMTDFLGPILSGWSEAGKGQFHIDKNFGDTSIHYYHGALMAIFAEKLDTARTFTEKLMNLEGLSVYEGERIADLQVALGETDSAIGFYKGLQVQGGDSQVLSQKIKALQDGDLDSVRHLIAPLRIKTAADGAALTMLDMARILYQEHSDGSAKLFVNMALALDSKLFEARLLLANVLARNGRYEEAFQQYLEIPENDSMYSEAQHLAADMLAETEKYQEAIDLLGKLYESNGDIEALIRVGDLYRQKDDYNGALREYNKAAQALGENLDEDYWYLLYARGMTYERLGDWDNAEKDLKQALEYRPNNPYLMNYLGYGWADQGKFLEQSLELIENAVALRPTDGYITDSLGWVHYMMGSYNEALPFLERAVELLPYDPVVNDHLGDVYWRVGRRLEARFQWERALNHAEDESMIESIRSKLKTGLKADDKAVNSSQSSAGPDQ
jgi:tetratricopeptide (TPR) repeat protein